MAAAGPVSACAAAGVVEFVDLHEVGQFDPLHDELGDAIAAGDGDGLLRIEVDQTDLDLTSVSGVDGPRRVDDRQPGPGREPRAGVDEADGADRQGDRDPGRYELTPPGGQFEVCLLYTSPSPRD